MYELNPSREIEEFLLLRKADNRDPLSPSMVRARPKPDPKTGLEQQKDGFPVFRGRFKHGDGPAYVPSIPIPDESYDGLARKCDVKLTAAARVRRKDGTFYYAPPKKYQREQRDHLQMWQSIRDGVTGDMVRPAIPQWRAERIEDQSSAAREVLRRRLLELGNESLLDQQTRLNQVASAFESYATTVAKGETREVVAELGNAGTPWTTWLARKVYDNTASTWMACAGNFICYPGLHTQEGRADLQALIHGVIRREIEVSPSGVPSEWNEWPRQQKYDYYLAAAGCRQADLCRDALVGRTAMQDWRQGRLKDSSKTTKRIEDTMVTRLQSSALTLRVA
ncbi:MAG: hypothetical protein ABSH56_35700 [Bryobacteraceae bacterium]